MNSILRVLRREAELVPLTSKGLDILLALVERAGKVLGRKELQHEVWGGDEIGDSTIPTHIKNLRKKFDKHGNGGEFIRPSPGASKARAIPYIPLDQDVVWRIAGPPLSAKQ